MNELMTILKKWMLYYKMFTLIMLKNKMTTHRWFKVIYQKIMNNKVVFYVVQKT